MPSIADTYITMLPETSKLADGIRRAFREVDPTAREAGARWGREIEQGIGKPKVELQADTAKARAEIDAAARDRKATVEVDADTMASSVERGISQGGQAGIGALQPALLGVGATMLAGIASALSGLAGLVPAGLLGAGGVVGTLVVGLDGVKDAYDAVNKAAQSSGQDQIDKARETATAQRGLTDAVQSQAQAQRDVSTAYRDAKNNLDDLNLSLQGGKISEAQAYNNVLKARRDLAKGGFKDTLEQNDAILRVQSSEQQWQESKQRNVELSQKANDANSKGVENSDQVVSAKERERKANEQVAAAQDSLSLAQNKTSAAAKDAVLEMANLSPQAQAFVDTLMAMKPQFQEFKNSIQDALFANLGPQFQQLATTYLPLLQQFMGGMASTMNQAFGQIATFLQNPQTMAAMQQIFANIGSSFQIWAQALQPFSEAFLKITQVGSGFLPQLAQMVVNVANAFNQWAQSGQLDQWMQTGMTTLRQLGDIIGKLIPMFGDLAPIGTATLNAISSILTTLAPYIPKLADAFTNLINALTPLITDILNLLLPLLTQTAAWLGKHPQLIQDVVVAFLAWKTISGVSTLLGNLGKVSGFLRTTLPADAAAGAAGMSSALGPVAALVAGIYAATSGHPEDYLTPGGSKSIKTNVDQNHWAKVLFGDAVGGWLEKNVFNTSPSASAAPFSPNDVYGPMSRNALDQIHGTDGSFPAAPTSPAPTNPLVPTGQTTGLTPGQTWTPGPGQTPLQWVVGKGWVPLAAAPTGLPTAPTAPPGALNWDALAQSEAGGNWANKSNPKYMGGLQFDQQTWDAFKPAGAPINAADASKDQQIAAAQNALNSGRTPQSLWPQNYQQLYSGSAPTMPTAPSSAVDAALLAHVPAGRYDNGPGDLTKGLADCSSAVEDLVNLMQGRPTAGRNMSTANEADWLTQHGFLPTNVPMPGTFQVGFNSGHTQATLPGGTNFNWGSDSAAAKGGVGGTGAWDPAFPSHYYLPGSSNYTPGQMPSYPGTGGPAGTTDDPMNVQLPASQVQQMGPGQQLGQDILGGMAQVFGLDGSVFKDPTSFGLFKLFKGFMGLKPKDGGSSDGSISGSGGGGGGLFSSLLQGIIPQPFGPLQSGSPKDAPGQFMPGMPGSEGGGGVSIPQIPQAANTATGQPGANNSINFYGPVGHAAQAMDAGHMANVPRMRQQLRPLP